MRTRGPLRPYRTRLRPGCGLLKMCKMLHRQAQVTPTYSVSYIDPDRGIALALSPCALRYRLTATSPPDEVPRGGCGSSQRQAAVNARSGGQVRRTEGGEASAETAVIPTYQASINPSWHALWTSSNCEQLVYNRLTAKGLEVFLPRIGSWSRRGGQRVRSRAGVKAPLAPANPYTASLG